MTTDINNPNEGIRPLDKLEKVAELDLKNPQKLPEGSVALTVEGKTFTKAAELLLDYQKRRRALMQEYQEIVSTKLNPLLEDIARCHIQIDAIIQEMSKS